MYALWIQELNLRAGSSSWMCLALRIEPLKYEFIWRISLWKNEDLWNELMKNYEMHTTEWRSGPTGQQVPKLTVPPQCASRCGRTYLITRRVAVNSVFLLNFRLWFAVCSELCILCIFRIFSDLKRLLQPPQTRTQRREHLRNPFKSFLQFSILKPPENAERLQNCWRAQSWASPERLMLELINYVLSWSRTRTRSSSPNWTAVESSLGFSKAFLKR